MLDILAKCSEPSLHTHTLRDEQRRAGEGGRTLCALNNACPLRKQARRPYDPELPCQALHKVLEVLEGREATTVILLLLVVIGV